MSDRGAIVRSIFSDTIRAHEGMAAGDLAPILAAVDAILNALKGGGKVLVFGNGGSAADAQHFCAELVGRFVRERRPLAAIALTTDTSVLTSIANDYEYNQVFARQLEAIGRPGDVVLGISTSGRSGNVVLALETARRLGLRSIALTGRDGGSMAQAADIHINVPVTSTARVQEVQRTIAHAICELIERSVTESSRGVGDLESW